MLADYICFGFTTNWEALGAIGQWAGAFGSLAAIVFAYKSLKIAIASHKFAYKNLEIAIASHKSATEPDVVIKVELKEDEITHESYFNILYANTGSHILIDNVFLVYVDKLTTHWYILEKPLESMSLSPHAHGSFTLTPKEIKRTMNLTDASIKLEIAMEDTKGRFFRSINEIFVTFENGNLGAVGYYDKKSKSS